MNKSFYLRKSLIQRGAADGGISEFKEMVFATGNTFYPGIRKSLPIYLMDSAVKSFGLEWTDEGRILRVESPRATFIKPKLWEEEYYASQIREAMERAGTRTFNNVTIITHSDEIPIGAISNGVGDPEDGQFPLISRLIDELRSDTFKWTVYGVAPKEGKESYGIQEIPSTMLYASQDCFENLFLDCKIPFHEMGLVDEVLKEPLINQWYNEYFTR